MTGQISFDDLTDKVEIRGMFSGWREVTREEAIKFAIGWHKRITTNIDKEAFINKRLRGATYTELIEGIQKP